MSAASWLAPRTYLSREEILTARASMTRLRALQPRLRLDDRIGFATKVVALRLERSALRRGAPVDVVETSRCQVLALAAVVASHASLARMAGALPYVIVDEGTAWSHAWEWFCTWTTELRAIESKGRTPAWGAALPDRERLMFRLSCDLASQRVVGGQALLAALRKAVRKARAHDSVVQLQAADLEDESLAVELHLLGDPTEFAYVRTDGRIDMGCRQLVRALRSPVQPLMVSVGAAGGGKRIDPPYPGALCAQLEQVAAVDAARRMREVIAVRQSRTRPGSARRRVLGYAEQLLLGDVTLQEVARATGMARSTLSDAWSAEKAALVAHPSVRQMGA